MCLCARACVYVREREREWGEFVWGNLDDSVDRATDYRLNSRGFGIRFPPRARGVSFFNSVMGPIQGRFNDYRG
jgi:hypothetical protein